MLFYVNKIILVKLKFFLLYAVWCVRVKSERSCGDYQVKTTTFAMTVEDFKNRMKNTSASAGVQRHSAGFESRTVGGARELFEAAWLERR